MENWSELLLKPNSSILQAIEVMDHGAVGAAIVVDNKRRLLGIVTDGDVRRGLLRHLKMEIPVTAIMNDKPKFARIGIVRSRLLSMMRSLKINHIPILDQYDRVIDFAVLEQLSCPERMDNPVVLMAGGFGQRLLPLTRHCPKPLLKIGNKPVLEICLEQLISYGFNDFYLTLFYRGDMIRDYFEDGSRWHVNINYLEEQVPLGTAGALGLFEQLPNKAILVMNGDIMTQVNFQHLLNFHHEQGTMATLCVRPYQNTIPYGVVHMRNTQLIKLEEKPVQDFFINAGIYVLDPEVLHSIEPGEPLDMPDLLKKVMIKDNVAVFPIREYWMDIGQIPDFEQAHQDYAELFMNS